MILFESMTPSAISGKHLFHHVPAAVETGLQLQTELQESYNQLEGLITNMKGLDEAFEV